MSVNRKKKLVLVGFTLLTGLLIALNGCSTQSPPPAMPKFTTDQGKACARECIAINSQCIEACSKMVGGTTTAMQRAQCLDNCNQTLADCYSTCE